MSQEEIGEDGKGFDGIIEVSNFMRDPLKLSEKSIDLSGDSAFYSSALKHISESFCLNKI